MPVTVLRKNNLLNSMEAGCPSPTLFISDDTTLIHSTRAVQLAATLDSTHASILADRNMFSFTLVVDKPHQIPREAI